MPVGDPPSAPGPRESGRRGALARGALILGLAHLVAAGQGKPKELVPNGGFETGIEGWRTLDMSGEASFELDQSVKHGGRQSLRFEKKGSGRPDFLKWVGDLPVREGEVAVSIACRADKKAKPEIAFYFFDAGDQTIGKGYVPLGKPAGGAKAFEVLEKELEIPKGAVGCGINVSLAAPGVVWIDDASVAVLPDPKKAAASKGKRAGSLIENGDFEESLDGWIESRFGSGTAEAALDGEVKAGGKRALRLSRASPRLHPPDAWTYTTLELGEPARLELALAVRTRGAARALVVLQALDARGIALETSRKEIAQGDFAPVKLEIRLPRSSQGLAVTLAIQGEGEAWFDSLELERK